MIRLRESGYRLAIHGARRYLTTSLISLISLHICPHLSTHLPVPVETSRRYQSHKLPPPIFRDRSPAFKSRSDEISRISAIFDRLDSPQVAGNRALKQIRRSHRSSRTGTTHVPYYDDFYPDAAIGIRRAQRKRRTDGPGDPSHDNSSLCSHLTTPPYWVQGSGSPASPPIPRRKTHQSAP